MQKTITLIRHGKPDFATKYSFFSLLPGYQVKQFINDYNNFAVIDPGRNNHIDTLKKICVSGDLFLCSTLRRTGDSFRLLGVNNYNENDLLIEAELPSGIVSKRVLPLSLWITLLRIFWFIGGKRDCESYRDFRTRVKEAAKTIESMADEYNNIVIMAHGFLNRFLVRELASNSWAQIKKAGGNSYWSYRQLQKNDNL